MAAPATLTMNKLQIWQHPFVDLFKYVHIADWSLAHKEGDVTETIDKVLGKRVFCISGSVSAANYIQIPKAKAALKALGLTGKFLYFEVCVPPGKLFALHLDFAFVSARTKREESLRVSISNIFRGGKATSGLQLHCSLGPKWTVLCLDLLELLRSEDLEHLQSHSLRSVTVCANIVIRGIYTSDILYMPKTLPKEMSFKVKDIEDWAENYDWVTLPGAKENCEEKPKTAPAKTQKPVPRPTRSTPRIPLKKPARPQKPKPAAEALPVQEETAEPPVEPLPPPVDPFEEFDDRDSMEPDPLLRLRSVLGYTPLKSGLLWLSGSLLEHYSSDFTCDCSEFILCSSGPSLLLLNPINHKQHILFGHLQQVDFIRATQGTAVVTAQSSPPLLFLWNLISRQAPVPIHPYKLEKIVGVDISASGQTVVVAGMDSYSRYSVQMLDVSKVAKGRTPVVIAKQLSDFTINDVRFEPIAEERIMTVGKGSIRFWKVKNEHLPGTSVTFTEVGRKDEFLCIDYREAKTAVIGSISGCVFLISLHSKAVESVYQVHTGAVLSLRISADFCVTAGSDGAVRVWPHSFTECSLDLSMTASVLSVDISPSGQKLAIGASSCSMGVMDLQASEFTTLVRSHAGRIVGADMHPLGLIVTAGEDRTLRIWSDTTLAQTHEFVSERDEPICPTFHPRENVFACGFSSGFIRVFDIDTASMTTEVQQFRAKTELCAYSSHAKWLLAVCEDGTWSLLDVARSYQAVKSQTVERPPPFRAAAFAPDGNSFIVVGTNGTCICVWDCLSLAMKAKFTTGGTSIRSLQFDSSGGDLLVVTNSVPAKLHVYSVAGYKLTMLREFAALHPGAITAFATSLNRRYLLTSGDDKVIRAWDYTMQGDGARCQGFLGHTSLTDLMFINRSMTFVITASRSDGLFVWDFLGVVGKLRPPKPPTPEPEAKPEGSDERGLTLEPRDEYEPAAPEAVQELLDLAETSKPVAATPPSSQQLALSEQSAVAALGFSPHAVIWEPENGWLFHTVGTSVSMMELKDNSRQRLLIRHLDCVSCIALSASKTVLATAVGSARLEGFADIVLWDTRSGREVKTLSYHDQGVSSMDFTPCSNYLVSIGNTGDSIICAWEVASGSLLSTSVTSGLVHSLAFDRTSLSLEFAVIGNDSAAFWRINKYRKLEFQTIDAPRDCGDFLSVCYTLAAEPLLLLGTSKGSVVCVDSRSNAVLKVVRVVQEAISALVCSETRVILGGAGPNLYSWTADNLLTSQPEMLLLDGGVAALSFPREGEEGVVGTTNGTIWYVNWTERATIKIHTAHSMPVRTLAIREGLLVSGSDDRSLRVWDLKTVEPISQFSLPNAACLCLDFHPSEAYLIGGFSDGTVRAFDVSSAVSMGKCRVYSSPATAVSVSADGACVLAGSETGILTAIFVETWQPLRVRLFEFGMAGAGVECIRQAPAVKCLLAATTAGRINVWQRKSKFDPELFPKQDDGRLFSDERSEFNLIDVFDMVATARDLHPDQLTQIDTSQQVSVDVHSGAAFSPVDESLYLSFVSALPTVFVRDFKTHEIIKKISLDHYVTTLTLSGSAVILGTSDRLVLILRDNEVQDTLVGHSDSVTATAVGADCVVSCAGAEVIKWQPPALR